MISLVLGMPGSGKTYYVVDLIRKKYLQNSDIFFRVREGIVLITNIRLRLDSEERYIYIEDFEKFAELMNVETAKKLIEATKAKLVYVLDECQVLFTQERRNSDIFFFLQYHRHLSVDIILITQTSSSLPRRVFELAEFVVEAVPKSVNPVSFKAFRYRVVHPLDHSLVLRRFHLGFNPVIFYLYQDMLYEVDEQFQKTSNAFLKPAVLFFMFVFVFFFSMNFFMSSLSRTTQTTKQEQKTQQNKPPANNFQLQYEDLVKPL